ncbi:TPA: hypothetical protein I9786_002816 [Serratia marcescens]|nr:hypothetical protein [Serratia marcescens]HAT5031480.1 hypothetical protein [Serratia marcescens]
MTLTTERQQFAEQNEMSMDFVNWFFDEKKDGCGNAWFIMAAAMWEGWKGRANREAQPFGYVYTSKDGVAVNFGYELPFMPEKWKVTPVYTAPPAPAVNSAPDFEAWFVEKYKQPERLVKNEDGGTYKFSGVQMAFSAWGDGRAAMLAQPVSQRYTLPEGGNG